jgi:hypothetical protein
MNNHAGFFGDQGSQEAGAGQIRLLIFSTNFAFLLAYRLDTIVQSEWRLPPLIDLLADEPAYKAFVALHLPFLVILIW